MEKKRSGLSHNRLEQIHTFLRPMTRRVCRSPNMAFGHLFMDWKYIVGPKNAAIFKPLKVTKSMGKYFLHVRVAQETGLFLFHYEEPTLLHAITLFFGKPLVSGIKISAAPTKAPVREAPSSSMIDTTVEDMVHQIKDPDLSEALRRLGHHIFRDHP